MKPRQIASLTFLLLVLAVGLTYAYHRRDRFALLLEIPISGLVSLAALRLLARHVEGLTLRLALRDLGKNVSPVEGDLLSWATLYWNYLPLKAGTGATAYYLKRQHRLPYSRFAVYAATMQLIRIMSIGMVGLAACSPLLLRGDVPPWMPALFGLTTLSIVLIMAVPVKWRYEGRRWLFRALSQTGQAWDVMRTRRRLLAVLGGWKVAQVLLNSASIFLCFRLIGVDINMPQAMLVMLLRTMAVFVPILPDGLGVREALGAGAAVAVGFSFADGVVASTLARAVTLVLVLAIGPPASQRLFLRAFPGKSAAGEEMNEEDGPQPEETTDDSE